MRVVVRLDEGGSLCLPAEILGRLGIRPGQAVRLSVSSGQIILSAVEGSPREPLTLEEEAVEYVSVVSTRKRRVLTRTRNRGEGGS